MKRLFYPLLILLLAVAAGCASMSKKECMNADWQAIGYSEGSRGIHYSNLAKHRNACSEYQIIPNDGAYRAGWEQGIRRYCTADTGYRIGSSGQAYGNFCPQDVEADFLSGWDQGVRQYCSPDNALRQGLAGYQYNGVCPAELAGAFQDFYRLGIDVRGARGSHEAIEQQLARVQRALTAEKNPQQRRKLLYELERLQHEEERSEANTIALEACMSDDWYEAGVGDGEAGLTDRGWEIANVCRNYGIGADMQGYREGWLQGVSYYCSYESGLYVGQSNQAYLGVCSGYGHAQFWRGYEYGRALFRADRYEAHPRPVHQPASRQTPRQPRPQVMPEPEHRMPANQQPTRPITVPDHRMQQPVPDRSRAVESVRERAGSQARQQQAQPKIQQRPQPPTGRAAVAAPAAKQAEVKRAGVVKNGKPEKTVIRKGERAVPEDDQQVDEDRDEKADDIIDRSRSRIPEHLQ